jgi:hypothetical protein
MLHARTAAERANWLERGGFLKTELGGWWSLSFSSCLKEGAMMPWHMANRRHGGQQQQAGPAWDRASQCGKACVPGVEGGSQRALLERFVGCGGEGEGFPLV